MALSKMSHFCTMFSVVLLMIGVIKSTNHDLEDPFLFRFGPDQNDTFNLKLDDGCSSEQNLSYSFSFGENNYSSLFVCSNGYISFKFPFTSYWPRDFDTVTLPLIVALFGDVNTYDNFLDEMCDTGKDLEFVCRMTTFTNSSDGTNFNLFLNYNEDIINETIRNKTIEWEQKLFDASIFDMYYDDYISRLVFGKSTTKYVNLANNIFKREMNTSDKKLAQDLVRVKISNFTADWGYLATWYKVGPFPGRIDAFNSFQVAITCGFANANKRCFVLFDYFELQWGWNAWQGQTFARAGFADGEGRHNWHCFF